MLSITSQVSKSYICLLKQSLVLVLMTLEMIFKMLEKLTYTIVKTVNRGDTNVKKNKFDPIGFIVDPLADYVLVKDKSGLGKEDFNGTFVKYCKSHFKVSCQKGICQLIDLDPKLNASW